MSDHIGGFEALDRKLKALADPKKQIAATRSAVTFAVTPVVQQARINAPKGKVSHKTNKGRLVAPGAASRSITKKVKVSRDKSRVYGSVGPKREFWYVTLYDKGFRRGSRSRKVKRASRKGSLSSARLDSLGDSRSHVAGNAWLRKALESRQEEVVRRFGSKMKTAIEKQARK